MVPSTARPAAPREGLEGREVFSSLVFSAPSLPISGAGFPSVPVGKSPMVEQAVQTGSVDNLNAKKLLPGKATVGMQLNGRPAQPGGKTTSGTCPFPSWCPLHRLRVAPCFLGFSFLSSFFFIQKPAPPAPHRKHRVFSQGLPLLRGPCASATPLPSLGSASVGACLTLSFCALDVVQPTAVQSQGQVNDENRRPQRRRSGNSCCCHLSSGEPRATRLCSASLLAPLLGLCG